MGAGQSANTGSAAIPRGSDLKTSYYTLLEVERTASEDEYAMLSPSIYFQPLTSEHICQSS